MYHLGTPTPSWQPRSCTRGEENLMLRAGDDDDDGGDDCDDDGRS